jgi:hypothetical protein
MEWCQHGQLFAFKVGEEFRLQMSAGKGKSLFAEVEYSHLPCPVVDISQPVPVPAEQV